MANKKPAILLEHYLKQLKLPTMLRQYPAIAAACAKEGQDHTAFLLRMAERELLEREQRAAERRLKAAKFPVLKTLDTFDFTAQPGINKPLVLDLMRGDYLEVQDNVLFMGNPGTGKTHLATALGHSACAQGKRVRFFSVTGLVTQLLEAREERQLERLFNRLAKHHLIILDEFGYVPFTKAGAELLFEVVSRAYERQSIVLTTNLPFENWTEILGNERMTGALLDRLTHRVHIIEANGESYRLKDAKKRAKRNRGEKSIKTRLPLRKEGPLGGGNQGASTQAPTNSLESTHQLGDTKAAGATLLNRHPLHFYAAAHIKNS